MAVEITSHEGMRAWLEGKPREWSQVIALRCALRVVPVALDPNHRRGGSPDPQLTAAIFRAMAVSSAAAKIPADDTGRRAARAAYADANASRAARAAPAYVAANAAAFAAYAAANAAYAAANAAAYAADAAANAAANAARAAYADAAPAYSAIWKAIESDCEALEAGTDPVSFLQLHIWPSAPDWWSDAWDAGRKWLSASGEDFEIWREWYHGRVEGLPHAFAGFDDAADQQFYRWIVEQDDDWWKRELGEVNAEIKAFVDRLRKTPPSDAELQQNPRAFTFSLDQKGYSVPDDDLLPNGLQGDADERDNHSEIIRLIDAALVATAGDTNAKEIAEPTELLRDSVGESIEELRPRWFVLRARDLIRWVEESKSDDSRIASLSPAQNNAFTPLVTALKMIAEFSPKLAELWHGKLGQTGTPLTREMLDSVAEALRASGQTTALAQSIIEASNQQVAPDAPDDDPSRVAASETSRNVFRKMGGTLKKAGDGAKDAENIISLGERAVTMWNVLRGKLPDSEVIARILGYFGGG